MKIILALLLFAGTLKADMFGDGNLNQFFGGAMMTNFNVLSNQITIAVWLRIRNTGTGLEQKNVFFGKGRLDFGPLCQNLCRISGSKFQFNYTDGVGGLHSYTSDSTFVWTNRTRLVALTYIYTNAASMQMYIDGVPITGSWTSGNGTSNCLSNEQNFTLSCPTSQSSGGGMVMGDIGPSMAWTTNLTGRQILDLYNARVHGLTYVKSPEFLVFNMTWDTMRYVTGQPVASGYQNPSRLPPERGPYATTATRNMPSYGAGGGTFCVGNRILSFIPNE